MTAPTGRADRETLTPLARWLEVCIIVAMLILFGFFLAHQLTGTGLFTDRFTPFAMICLYVPILISLIAPALRAVTGRRQPARLFDAAMSLSLALGSLWLAIVFPFDFHHLPDILPTGTHFLLAWITNGFARVVLILQVIIGVINTLKNTWDFFTFTPRSEPAPLRQKPS